MASPSSPRDPRASLGRRAEDLAARFLEERGYEIVVRNWRRPEGELDIVASDPDGTCVFCEVRSRTGTRTGEPVEAVTARKRLQVIRVARVFLAEGNLPAHITGYRFDVIAVSFSAEEQSTPAEVIHIPRAFETTT